ncbi:50S ribosomal protein L1 [Candidatus Peregrinibacteria bacterium]|nr:50S ribosomal protein L1 [Candidatus Peregrinibacteria bacterium]
MKKHGKKYREALKLIDKPFYTLDEAISLLKKTSTTKFDSTCEVHFKLGVDPKQADQNVRTTVVVPHGTGKKVRVVAFVGEEKIKEAKAAGAVEAGTSELIEKIEKGWLDFDVAIATPDQMKDLAKVAKVLGQKRLMPNPKSGTVTVEVTKTINELQQGKIELRLDKEANLHSIFGKVSFDEDKLKENLKAVIKAVTEVKPSSIKGTYLNTISISSTMGPGIGIDLKSL